MSIVVGSFCNVTGNIIGDVRVLSSVISALLLERTDIIISNGYIFITNQDDCVVLYLTEIPVSNCVVVYLTEIPVSIGNDCIFTGNIRIID